MITLPCGMPKKTGIATNQAIILASHCKWYATPNLDIIFAKDFVFLVITKKSEISLYVLFAKK